MSDIKDIEQSLNSFDSSERDKALNHLKDLLAKTDIQLEASNQSLNLHCHTFYSFNGYGYSPSYIVWWGKKTGRFAMGLVDFDVLDGVGEFLNAGKILNIRTVCGIETRVFIPELIEHEINSPGEPGIAYHMGVGFVSTEVPESEKEFLDTLKQGASGRTEEIVNRVNRHLDPLSVDFKTEVLPLTPAGNATERHVCTAYYSKAESLYPDNGQRTSFWSGKLGVPEGEISAIIDNPVKLQAMIRSKTMKAGGAGYVKPNPDAFPPLSAMNNFVRNCGAIPTLAWLNGLANGEQALDELLELHNSYGMAAVNIIPDRNWNISEPDEQKRKVNELHRFINAAKSRDLPIFVGTEMNAPGQKLIDDFTASALQPYIDDFIDGAAIAFAHTLLQPAQMGYLSSWAEANFSSTADKNAFFATIGRKSSFKTAEVIETLDTNITARELSDKVG